MKNIILLFVIVFFCIFRVEAQKNTNKFRIGLTTSLEKNVSSDIMALDKIAGYSADYNKTNYRLGLSVEYQFKEKISINTAINYSNKDFTGTYYCVACNFFAAPSPEHIDFRFIEIPMTLKYYFLPNKVKLFGEFGVANLLSLNKEVTDNTYSLGIKFGGGLAYNLTEKISLQIAMDYTNGISKLNKESDFKLKTLALGIGIMKRL